MKRFEKWASREYPLWMRIVVSVLVGGTLFVFLIPYLLIVVFPGLDAKFGFPPLDLGPWNMILGVLDGSWWVLFCIQNGLLPVLKGKRDTPTDDGYPEAAGGRGLSILPQPDGFRYSPGLPGDRDCRRLNLFDPGCVHFWGTSAYLHQESGRAGAGSTIRPAIPELQNPNAFFDSPN